MVSKNDVFLIGGGLLAFLLLKERVPETQITEPISDFTRVQRINIEEIQAAETRKEQLENIRQQILGFEQAQAQQKISFIEEEIGKAQAVGSEYQAYLAQPTRGLSKTAYEAVKRFGSLEGAAQYLARGTPKQQLQLGTIKRAMEREQAVTGLEQVQEFIGMSEEKIAEIKARQAELSQIV